MRFKIDEFDYWSTDFEYAIGVDRDIFNEMLKILHIAYREKMHLGGRKNRLSVKQMLYATLDYERRYQTYAKIAYEYNIDEANIYRAIKWTKNILLKNGFVMPERMENKNFYNYPAYTYRLRRTH